MTAQILIDAFRLPAAALVGQRIPKKLLVEQGAPTAADKRLITDAVDELWWQAALKPGTVGVPAYQASEGTKLMPANDGDAVAASADVTDVIELALVSAHLRPATREAQAQRLMQLMQLIHRAIPYPVLLVTELPAGIVLSVAHKRASLGEASRWVVTGGEQTHPFNPAEPSPAEAAFMASLALEQLPAAALVHLGALYQAVADRITALAVAQVTGRFAAPEAAPAASHGSAAAHRQALAERSRLLEQIATARSAAAKARQMSQRVELNLQIQRLQSQLQDIRARLSA
jgi:hypothetical protein